MRGYWKLKEEALGRSLWRTGFERSYGSAIKQTTEGMNKCTWSSFLYEI